MEEKLDLDKFNQHFSEYVEYCKRGLWLTYNEGYKFRFGRWLNERVHFETQSDEEILALCNLSQEQVYQDGSAKGINFIVANKRYSDHFIVLDDIKVLRRLHLGGLIEEDDLKDSPLSFPKFSVWAGVLIPETYKIYGSEELSEGLAYFFNLTKYPKSGLKGFNIANHCLNSIAETIKNKYSSSIQELIQMLFPEDSTVREVDLIWIIQDFILYYLRRVLHPTVNYYWVNQGDNYKVEMQHGIVAAPNHSLHHHLRLKHLHEGDIIVHYANSVIRATSKVIREAVIKQRPYDPLGDKDLIVEVHYNILENPIPINTVQDIFNKDEELLPKKYGPFTKDLGVVQMYMCIFNEESFKRIFNQPSYWIFQGSPEIFDTVGAIHDGHLKAWSVHAHKAKIKIGDKIILWLTGKDSGCYSLAEVESDIFNSQELQEERLYYKNDPGGVTSDKVRIKITHDYTNSPILFKELKDLTEFNSFKGGNQGTNFSATKEQYDILLGMSEKNNDFIKFLQKFDTAHLQTYFTFLNEIISKNNLSLGDKRLSFTYRENRLNLTVGQRYSWNLKVSDPKGNFGVLSKEKLNDSSEQFEGNLPRPWYTYMENFNPTPEERENIHEGITFELNRSDVSGYRKHNKEDFEKYVFERINKKSMSESLNQILYGPPGTGKTYNTINKSLELIGENIEGLKRQEIVEMFKNKIVEGQIVFTTFHQSFSYEDFIEGIKPVTVNSKILYEIQDGIFKTICESAMESIKEFIADKKTIVSIESTLTFEQKYKLFVQAIQQKKIKVFTKTGIEAELFHVSGNGNMRLTTGASNLGYIISSNRLRKLAERFPEPSIIQNVHDEIRNVIGGSHASLYYAALVAYTEFDRSLLEEISQEGAEFSLKDLKLTKEEISDLPKFILVIDEINRGNVSAIFGELITLIEEDKRLFAENAISLDLAYSKGNPEKFIVPPNVYILGTMNTADRSVEALDTALRRRFAFTEMLPEPNLIAKDGKAENGKIGDLDIVELLTVMNKRIELLVDRDHTIGHAFFMNVDSEESLKDTFAKNIIPLLQEYFYGDYSKMEMVIGPLFFEVENKIKNQNEVFAVSNQNYELPYRQLKLVNVSTMKMDEFKFALKRLLDINYTVPVTEKVESIA